MRDMRDVETVGIISRHSLCSMERESRRRSRFHPEPLLNRQFEPVISAPVPVAERFKNCFCVFVIALPVRCTIQLYAVDLSQRNTAC